MATKTFEELKQMAIQIRDEKANKQNTATRIGTQMVEHLNKLEQEYYDKTTLDKRVTELNISELYKTQGIGGTNRYTLAGAIAQVDSKYRTIVGLKITFINNETSKPETWVYNGSTFTSTTNWTQGSGSGGNKILEWNTDVATTRKQVLSQERKSLLQISYKNADGDIINEQYLSSAFTDTEWTKDANWEQTPNQAQLSAIKKSSNGFYEKVVVITGFGATGAAAGAKNSGDIYYNTDTKKLRRLVSGNSYEDYPFEDGEIYKNLSDGKAYEWNGEDMVVTEKEPAIFYLPNELNKNTKDLSKLQTDIHGNKTVITGFGTTGAAAGAKNSGDIYYNTDTKKLRRLVSGNSYEDYPFEDGEIYKNLSDRKAYEWNGEDMVVTEKEAIEGITTQLNKVAVINDNLKVVEITGFGTSGGAAGVTKVGDIYYNTDTKKLRRLVSGSSYEDYPFEDGEIYKNLSDRKAYEWNGEDMIISFIIYKYVDVKEYIDSNVGIFKYSPVTLEHVLIDDKTHIELYNEYDKLCEQYPTYIKRLDNGDMLDSLGNEIRLYGMRFYDIFISTSEAGGGENQWKEEYEYNRCLITSGVHGDEKSASWGLLLTIKDIISSNSLECEYIRNNSVLYIMPCINPSGFDSNTRNNANNANINRDTISFAEMETQHFKSVMDAREYVAYLDVHGTSGKNTYFEFPKNYNPQSDLYGLGAKYYSKEKQTIQRIYNDASYIRRFHCMTSTFDGLLSSYAVEKGVISVITETPRDFKTGGLQNYLDACQITQSMVISLLYMIINNDTK